MCDSGKKPNAHKNKIGYEINFTKYFYEYKPWRPLAEIKAAILALEEKIASTLMYLINGLKMKKYKNKYRIESARAQWWDYGRNGAYFITICTQNREHFFGEIDGGEMILSPLGVIADILWHEIPNHTKHVELGDFVVMPNHIHGILIIDNPKLIQSRDLGKLENSGNSGNVRTGHAQSVVQTGHALSLPGSESGSKSESESESESESNSIGQKRFQNIGKNTISSIIGSYKSAVTKHANRLGFKNGWQRLFHDHIIRNDAEYQRISNYIVNNPSNWKEDKFHHPSSLPNGMGGNN